MDLMTAIDIVTEDQRASYPHMTREQAVKHARYTIHPAQVAVPAGEEDPDPDMTAAYLLVLDAKPSQLKDALANPDYLDEGY